MVVREERVETARKLRSLVPFLVCNIHYQLNGLRNDLRNNVGGCVSACKVESAPDRRVRFPPLLLMAYINRHSHSQAKDACSVGWSLAINGIELARQQRKGIFKHKLPPPPSPSPDFLLQIRVHPLVITSSFPAPRSK